MTTFVLQFANHLQSILWFKYCITNLIIIAYRHELDLNSFLKAAASVIVSKTYILTSVSYILLML